MRGDFSSAFFTWLRKEKFVAGNPVESIEPFRETRKPIDYFRPVQMEELRDGCRTARERALIEVLRSTGARVGEITEINVADVDWQTGDILIQGEKEEDTGPSTWTSRPDTIYGNTYQSEGIMGKRCS